MSASDQLNDLLRRIENIVRAGTISAVDLQAVRCRVASGGLTSTWLPWYAIRAGEVKRWSPPSVGEQCIILAPSGDLACGVVIYGITSDANPSASADGHADVTAYEDGAVISYDRAAHKLSATLPAGGSAEITAPQQIKLSTSHLIVDAIQTDITGIVNIEGATTIMGLLTWLAGMAGQAAPSSPSGAPAAQITGVIKADDMLAGNISLGGHHHLWDSNSTSEAKP
jgi:phage baseplate assembly protein V